MKPILYIFWACILSGCSTAPLADVMDYLKPGKLGAQTTPPYGGVCPTPGSAAPVGVPLAAPAPPPGVPTGPPALPPSPAPFAPPMPLGSPVPVSRGDGPPLR